MAGMSRDLGPDVPGSEKLYVREPCVFLFPICADDQVPLVWEFSNSFGLKVGNQCAIVSFLFCMQCQGLHKDYLKEIAHKFNLPLSKALHSKKTYGGICLRLIA